MKKLVTFLSGLLLLLIMFAALCLSGAIYDVSQRATIETYFFQPNQYHAHRVDVPDTPESIGADVMRDMLIKRFITEYFYVIPDVNNIAQRTATQTALLSKMSAPAVFTEWVAKVVPTLQQMAEERKLRTVEVTNISKAPDQENYWIVEYDLITWDVSNDFSVSPTVSHEQLYISLIYAPGLREQINKKPIEYALESGIDPAAVFKIKITAVNSYDELGYGN